MRASTTSPLTIQLLGRFEVAVAGVAVGADAWRRRKPAALVKLLALAPGHRLHREQLMDRLWPELDLSAAGANLRKAIHQARGALDGALPGGAGRIEFAADVVSLTSDGLVVDVDAFRAALAAARRAGDRDGYRGAVALYGGDLLPDDPYEEWAIEPRRELREAYLQALAELGELLEADGDVASATETVRTLVGADPLREESHVALMRLYAIAGRRVDALRQYDALADALDTELGVEPGADAQKLREEINARQLEQPELTAELWERVGDLRVLAGDGDGAARAFEQAIESGGLPDGGARLERKCGEAWLMQHRPDVAAAHLEAAERLAADPAERSRVLRARANLAWESRDVPAARTYAEAARDLATSSGTPDDVASAREAIAIVSHFEGEWREGLEAELERLADGDDPAGQLARVFDIHHCIGEYHLYDDALAGSVEGYARRILDRAEEAGAVRAQAFAWCLLGESLLLHARWEEADGCLERSCALHESMGSRSGALPWQRRAELATCRGALDEVDAHLRRAAGITTVSAMASHTWGRIYATWAFAANERGEPERAMEAVQSAAAAAARYGDCPTCSALLNPVAAHAYAAIGDPDGACFHAEAAARVAGSFASSAWHAMAEEAAGSRSRAEGDLESARAHFAEAGVLYGRAGQPYWATRSSREAERR